MKTNSRLLTTITFIYIYMPIMFFLGGFTRIWISLPSIILCIYAIYSMFRDYSKENATSVAPVISKKLLFVIVVFLALICIFLGFGGVFYQSGDWPKHNAVLHDLVNKSWPVYYEKYENAMLTYYLGQYIIPGAVGKIVMKITGNSDLGFNIASIAMAIWAFLGILLVYINLVRITSSNTWVKQLRCGIVLIFFSGALPLVQLITSGLYGDNMYSAGNYHWLMFEGINIQYRSNLVMLRWVYPQVIVVWLITLLFIEHKKLIRHYVILFAPVLLYGTFSMVFFALATAGVIIFILISEKEYKRILLEVFSISNISTFFSLGIVLITYFWGYMQVEKPDYLAFHLAEVNIRNVWGILIFDLFMFGLYCICVYKEQKTNSLFYITLGILTLIPFFAMGLYNDFVMCTSIPGLFIVMTMVISYLNKNDNTREYGVRVGIIICCLMIGAWYPLMEVKENIHNSPLGNNSNVLDYYMTLEGFTDRESDNSKDLVYNYYTYDLKGKFFYEYIARKKIQ